MIPVATKVSPVIIPALCSNECQLSFSNPLKAYCTNSTIPVVVISKYINAIDQTNHLACAPANKKNASISKQGEKNIAITNAVIIVFFDLFCLTSSLK